MNTREFQFRDGSSDKFWRIELDGRRHSVQFGRRGTQGQTQTKEFATEAEARKSWDKLIAEKTKKGYVETTSAATPSPAPAARKRPPRAKEPEPTPEPAEAPRPVAIPSGPAERRIELEPEDWCLATWRADRRPSRSEPRPFDLATCLDSLRRVRFDRHAFLPDWSDAGIPRSMTRQEAHFWFAACEDLKPSVDLEALAARLSRERFDGRITAAKIRSIFGEGARRFGGEAFSIALGHLLEPAEIVELLTTPAPGYVPFDPTIAVAYARSVVPWLEPEVARELREQVSSHVGATSWPGASAPYNAAPAFILAAALGMHDEIRRVVESWEDGLYARADWEDHYQQPQLVVYGLGDPGLVEEHFRRLGLRIKTKLHVRGWLAHTEYAALDVVRDGILAETNRDAAEALVGEFARVHAPEAAGPMLALARESKAPKAARAWLDANLDHAIPGLVPIAAGRGALADAAIEFLRSCKKKGLGETIAAAVRALPAESTARVRVEVVDHEETELPVLAGKKAPKWLGPAVESAPRKKPIGWIAPTDLPPVVLDGRRLSDEHVGALLSALAASPLDSPHDLVAGVKREGDPGALDAFAWRLFERWIGEGAPSKEKWAMLALGHLGGDSSVLKLTPRIREWPGESQHARAVTGLEVLRAIGTDTALMQLNGIAQKLKFQGLKTKARQFMEDIAKTKGLTRAELEDRVVPDCGLDERGRRTFDFGARSFTFVLGPEMKPMVRDADGKLRDNLPSPNSKDDAARAKAATDDWKLMKKQIRDVAKIQAERLEQAMVTGRRWKPDDFAALVVKHPLLTHLARLLVWGAWEDARLAETFRVTEEQELSDARDEAFTLKAKRSVGLVHPLQLDEPIEKTWGQLFADYAIVPPFAQLGRPVHRLEKGEAKKSCLDRWEGRTLAAPTLVYGFEKLGWVRGLAQDAGCFDEHSRQFPAAGVTAVASYEGTVAMGYIDPMETLTLHGVYFFEGLREPSGFERFDDRKTLPLGKVDPVVLSETIHDLERLAAKAS